MLLSIVGRGVAAVRRLMSTDGGHASWSASQLDRTQHGSIRRAPARPCRLHRVSKSTHLSRRDGVQSIVMSMCVCPSVSPLTYLRNHAHGLKALEKIRNYKNLKKTLKKTFKNLTKNF